jgi:multidrug efflux pump subunit AcrA (membrane-fusion protein)
MPSRSDRSRARRREPLSSIAPRGHRDGFGGRDDRRRLALAAAILSVGLATACGRSDAGGAAEQPAKGEEHVRIAGDTVFVDSLSRELIGLEVQVPPRRAFGDWVQTTGTIGADPVARAVVSAPAQGRLESISVAPSDRVARGQSVASLSSPEFLAGSVQLRAPRAGVVTARLAEVGQIVDAGAPVVELADLGHVVVFADVFPEMLNAVHAGARVEVLVPGDSLPIAGSIASVDAQVDSITQAVRARIPLDNADGRLRPGTFVRIRIETRPGEQAILVPGAAVVRDSTGQWVYEPAGDGYVRRAVQARAAPGDSMAILSGVDPGRPLVVRGAYQLQQASFSFKGLTTFGEESGGGE